MNSWIQHAVWWHVYPLGFVGAEREAGACVGVVHRLDHLVRWLDYVVELGASGILLGPISGELVAQSILAGEPDAKLTPFSAERFLD